MIKTRFMCQSDVPKVVACQIRRDPDFDLDALPSYALDEVDIRIMMTQKYDSKRGLYETRCLVSETEPTAQYRVDIKSCIIYELQETRYEVVFLVAHPTAPVDTLATHIRHLMTKADLDDFGRNSVVFFVRDATHEYEIVRLLQTLGFTTKLVRDHFTNKDSSTTDAWMCEYKSSASRKVTKRKGRPDSLSC